MLVGRLEYVLELITNKRLGGYEYNYIHKLKAPYEYPAIVEENPMSCFFRSMAWKAVPITEARV